MVQNNHEYRLEYWAICLSVRSFARTAHSFACSALLVRSLCFFTWMAIYSVFFPILDHSAVRETQLLVEPEMRGVCMHDLSFALFSIFMFFRQYSPSRAQRLRNGDNPYFPFPPPKIGAHIRFSAAEHAEFRPTLKSAGLNALECVTGCSQCQFGRKTSFPFY